MTREIETVPAPVLKLLRILAVAAPTVFTMWVLYALEQHQIWHPDTPYRDLMTVVLLGTAMASSFLIFSRLKRGR